VTVQFSRFPARIVTSDGMVVRKAGIVVVDGRARVAERRGDVQVILDRADVARVERLPNRNTEVEFADGTLWTVSKGDGCSCKSPLRAWYTQALAGAV
jgi:hypothetical protein